MWVYAYVSRYPVGQQSIIFPGIGGTDTCELPNVGSRNQIGILCKSSKYRLTSEPFFQPNVATLLHFIYWLRLILCTCVYSCMCVWRPEVNLRCPTQELSTLFSETKTLRDLELNDSARVGG